MNRRPNRIVLALTGLLLVAAGSFALLAATGVIALRQPGDLYNEVVASVTTYSREWAAGGVVGGLLVAAVGAWLVRRQLTVEEGSRLGTVTLDHRDRGRTTLEAVAVARATAADLRAKRGVVDSAVRMVAFGSRPRLLVSLAVSADTEPHVALDHAEEVYQRLPRLLGTEAVHVDTRVRPTGEGPARVQ
ncbi:MAG TPA: hypothetical protein VGV63_01480 [Acidimicrobiales bacterium]|nr:hypothetical protein [Acidimicrobiales bacterium]